MAVDMNMAAKVFVHGAIEDIKPQQDKMRDALAIMGVTEITDDMLEQLSSSVQREVERLSQEYEDNM